MRIEIEKQIDEETKECWGFNLFDLTAVFVTWHKEIKPKGKRKWTVVAFWDKYGRNNMEEPLLPINIKSEALENVKELIN